MFSSCCQNRKYPTCGYQVLFISHSYFFFQISSLFHCPCSPLISIISIQQSPLFLSLSNTHTGETAIWWQRCTSGFSLMTQCSGWCWAGNCCHAGAFSCCSLLLSAAPPSFLTCAVLVNTVIDVTTTHFVLLLDLCLTVRTTHVPCNEWPVVEKLQFLLNLYWSVWTRIAKIISDKGNC